jgi:hypothetical protein
MGRERHWTARRFKGAILGLVQKAVNSRDAHRATRHHLLLNHEWH